MRVSIIIFCLAMLSISCTAPKHYNWGNYEDSLYDYYDDPSNSRELKLSLRGIINSTSSEQKIAPGIYAEYGYLLYREGQYAQALIYFQKEKDAWPESAPFMDKFIGVNATKSQTNVTNNTQ